MGHTIMDPDYGLTSACEGMKVCSRLQSSGCIRGSKRLSWCPAGAEDSPVLVVRSSRLQMCVQPEPGVCQSQGRSVIGAVCATVGT